LNFENELKKRASGSTVLGITIQNISSVAFPLSPLPEQQRIVDRIESLFAKLDQAKELVQNALDSFANRKAAILHQAFSGELTANWRKEHGVGIDSWEKSTLKQSTEIGSGGTPSRNIPEYYSGNVPWIKTGELLWNYIADSEEHISEKAIANSSARYYPANTVLVAMYGQGLTRGRAAILAVKAATNQAVCALQPKSNLLSRYLYYYFMCHYWDYREKAVGGNQPNYSATMVGKWHIDIPSMPEQQKIIYILEQILAKERQANELAKMVMENIDIMKKSILARTFRGELGTNDPSEENARVLLKKVLQKKM
jgi:type I restriction enzyme S subunit